MSIQPQIFCCLSDCLYLRFYFNTLEKAPSAFVSPWKGVPIPLTTFAIRSNNISSILYPLRNKFLHLPSHSGYRSHLLCLQIIINHKEGIWEAAYLQQTPKSPLHLPFSQGIIQKEKLAYVLDKKKSWKSPILILQKVCQSLFKSLIPMPQMLVSLSLTERKDACRQLSDRYPSLCCPPSLSRHGKEQGHQGS